MNVRPTTPCQTTRANLARTERDRTSPAPTPTPSDARIARTDNVEISSAARELRDRSTQDEAANASLSPERLTTILRRFADGHYDRPDVVDAIANGVLRDL